MEWKAETSASVCNPNRKNPCGICVWGMEAGAAVSKHTPGKWWAEVNGYGGFDIKATAPEGHEMVLCQRSSWPGRDLESIANGYLIAAAPDLLEALEAILKTMRHPDGRWYSMKAHEEDARDKAIAAIAKAVGK